MRTPKIEEILDQAIRRVNNGENISTVLSDYPESIQENLYDLLAITKLASELPKKNFPTPIKRRIYLDVPKQNLNLFRFLYLARSIYPIAFVLLITTLTGTVSAAMQSLPGDKLFAVKKALQTAEISLATNPEKKAELQLDLVAQRIEEAQTVIAKTDEASPAKDAAIAELNQQTEVALKRIQEIASTDAVTKNPELIKKAEHLTEEKRKVVATVDPVAAKERNVAHENTIASIKQIIATVNDQAPATLAPSNQITISSTIESIRGKVLKIEKNSFEITEETVIEDEEGNELESTDLGINDTVKVEGTIVEEKTVANKVTLVLKAKIVEKPVAPKPTPKPPVVIPPVVIPPVDPEPPVEEQGETPSVPEEKPQDTYTGFIPEFPNN
jgi:hypothetical protein